jgi:dihydroorotate dehydrogenase electron transfer subunit
MKLKTKTSKRTIKAKILSNKNAAPDYFMMRVDSAWLARNSSPGQFVAIKVQEKATDPLLRIPLGVHMVRKNGISLLYKVVGSGTELLSSKKKGQKIDILGPLGNGFDLAPLLRGKKPRAIVVAGGHGIAPLYALSEAIVRRKGKVDLFNGVYTRKHIVCSKELKKLGVKIHVATEDGTRGYKGYVTDLLIKELKRKAYNAKDTVIYACGPRPMLAALAKIARNFGIPAQVSLDAYMACGIGACFGCSVRTTDGYKLVCKDGPVFDAQQIMWKRER